MSINGDAGITEFVNMLEISGCIVSSDALTCRSESSKAIIAAKAEPKCPRPDISERWHPEAVEDGKY